MDYGFNEMMGASMSMFFCFMSVLDFCVFCLKLCMIQLGSMIFMVFCVPDRCMILFKKARDRTVVFDFLSA